MFSQNLNNITRDSVFYLNFLAAGGPMPAFIDDRAVRILKGMASVESPVLIQIDENPNCDSWDGQVFQPRTQPKPIIQVRCERGGKTVWCDISVDPAS